jgi:hypothetical protein
MWRVRQTAARLSHTVLLEPPCETFLVTRPANIVKMKRNILMLLLLIMTIQVCGQIDRFPAYRLVDVDSLDLKKDVQYLKTIKLTKDQITIYIDSKAFSFTSLPTTDSIFRTTYDKRYDLEISLWEVRNIDADSVNFKIVYTKRNKVKGTQKGKYFIIESLKIAKEDIAGIYVMDQSNRYTRKLSVIELGLLTIIMAGTLLFGSE